MVVLGVVTSEQMKSICRLNQDLCFAMMRSVHFVVVAFVVVDAAAALEIVFGAIDGL